MTTTLLLVRHAEHGLLGRVLAGRMPGVRLSPQGRAQAERLAGRLAREPIAAVHSSPLERAQETAAPIARAHGLDAAARESLNEIDFGDWTGAEFRALEADPGWGAWNLARGLSRAPGGESMLEAQARAVAAMASASEAHRGETVVLVSHCDLIRAMVCAVLGLSLDSILRFDIAPGSVSRVVTGPWGARLVGLNEGCP